MFNLHTSVHQVLLIRQFALFAHTSETHTTRSQAVAGIADRTASQQTIANARNNISSCFRDIGPRDVHGLDSSMDWIGLDWIGLGPMTVMYKILTAYVFQRNRPRLFYVIISDFCISIFHYFFHFLVFTDGAYCIVVPITSHRHVTLHFLFSAMKDVAHYIAAFLLFTLD